jgi:hypothetical protein
MWGGVDDSIRNEKVITRCVPEKSVDAEGRARVREAVMIRRAAAVRFVSLCCFPPSNHFHLRSCSLTYSSRLYGYRYRPERSIDIAIMQVSQQKSRLSNNKCAAQRIASATLGRGNPCSCPCPKAGSLRLCCAPFPQKQGWQRRRCTFG